MGNIVGGIVGSIGSILGGNAAAKKEDEAANTALTGYNYLNNNIISNAVQQNGRSAITNQDAALGDAATNGVYAQQGTDNAIQQLLTSPSQNNPAFQNYLNSTGYNFQLQQGTSAISQNAAAKGILNSGATAKALDQYGTNLASTTFNNYLGGLGGLATAQGQNAQSGMNLGTAYGGLVGQGLQAALATGQAGTQGGNAAAQQQAAAGQSEGSSLTNAFNIAGGTAQNAIPGSSNFFSTAAADPFAGLF